MFKRIKYRLLVYFLLLSLVPLFVSVFWFYRRSVSGLQERTYNQLRTVRETKRKEIETYFELIRQQAIYFAGGSLTLQALTEFKAAFGELSRTELPAGYDELLRRYYSEEFLKNLRLTPQDTITIEKLYPKDSRSILLQAQYLISNKTAFRPNVYNVVHEKYHNAFSTFTKTNGFYDVVLIEDETGYVLYSVNKEIDFGTSMLSDAHADSNLGRLFRKVRFSGLKYQATLCDFETYLPSGLRPAAFIASPIFDNEKKVGTLVFQVPIDKINNITTSDRAWREEGLGETGESYIVGADCKMRTDSRFIIESPSVFAKQTAGAVSKEELELISFYNTTVLFLSACNDAVKKALGNQSGTLLIKDYRGVSVLSSYVALNVPDVTWVFLSEIDEWEAILPVKAFVRNFLFIVLAVTGIVALAAVFAARRMSRPIHKLAEATKELGEGNLHVRVKITRQDELGFLETSFNNTVASLQGFHSLMLEKQDQILLQAKELSKVNAELTNKNKELDLQKEELLRQKLTVEQQKEEITAQAENLLRLNNEVTEINNSLETLVRERTQKLAARNQQLADYAFANAHKLRGPLTRILGLIKVIHISETISEKLHYLSLLDEEGRQLDEVVHAIQKLVADNSGSEDSAESDL